MTLTPFLTAFGAGLLASLSPCIYPMLPLTLGFLSRQAGANQNSETRKRLQIFSFFFGQLTTFTILGVVAVQLGEVFGFSSQSRTVNLGIGVFLALMAYGSSSEKAQSFFARLNQLLPSGRSQNSNLIAGFMFGVSSALVASPCSSPILGGVLSQIASQGNFLFGLGQMLFFSIGMSIIFLVVGMGLINLKSLPRAGQWLDKTHRLTTVLLALAAIYYFYLAFT